MPNGLQKAVEKALGLPSIDEVSGKLEKLPEEAKLRLVKQITDNILKMKEIKEVLPVILELAKVVPTIDIEKLTVIKDITANLLKLVRLVPIKELPFREIAEELKRVS